MKKSCFIILPFVLIISTCEKNNDGPNPDDYVNIPDLEFLYALINEGVDTNGDSLISYGEAEAVDTLLIGGWYSDGWVSGPKYGDIKSLVGIEVFKNLIYLECHENDITNLDLSNNSALTYLNCHVNSISTLDVSGCTALTGLLCKVNRLTSLDLSNNTELRSLDIGSDGTKETEGGGQDSQFTTLDVSNNTKLEFLACSYNQLTTLDVSNNTNLDELRCNENLLTALDVSNNTKLDVLTCTNNQLTTLDVSNNTKLKNLHCEGNQLLKLDISKNIQIGFNGGFGLTIGSMPSLSEVCVWTMPFPPEGVLVNTEGSPNVNFTTDCSN